jgi:hypothetical protein
MTEADRPLEHVVLRGGGMRRVDAEQRAEVDDEALRRRQLGRGDALPAGDEGIGGIDHRSKPCGHLREV